MGLYTVLQKDGCAGGEATWIEVGFLLSMAARWTSYTGGSRVRGFPHCLVCVVAVVVFIVVRHSFCFGE